MAAHDFSTLRSLYDLPRVNCSQTKASHEHHRLMRSCLLLQVRCALCYEHTDQLKKEDHVGLNSLARSSACIINSAETLQAHRHNLFNIPSSF